MSSLRNFNSAASHAAPMTASAELLLAWMAQARSGDRAAFGRVVSSLQDRLYNAVYRLVGHPDDALEVTQDAFTKALENIREFRGDAQPYTWLFRIAMNLAISQHRRKTVRRATSIDADLAGANQDQMSSLRERLRSDVPSPDLSAERRERGQLVMRALSAIDSEHRTLLVMRDIDGMDYNEMAEVMELPLGTVKSRLFRARAALREKFEELEK
jgi:RNA polymerase sigma-70 factor, ECF subfamily